MFLNDSWCVSLVHWRGIFYWFLTFIDVCIHYSTLPIIFPVKYFNSLAPGRFENDFQNIFFKLIPWIDTLSNSCETVLRRMPQSPSNDKSTLVQVMAWCRQAPSHYLSRCCPRSLSPYGVTRPQCVNLQSLFYIKYLVLSYSIDIVFTLFYW